MIVKQLIDECKKNNTKAQEQLYKELAPQLFALCLKYSRNYAEAQDNLQESFLLLFKNISKFSNKGSFEGWAKRLTINYVLQQYRNKGYLELVTDEFPESEEVEIEEENISLDYLIEIIQQLPDRYRLVFSLYVMDGYSHKEIANMMEINVGTSKSNLARAKGILKQKIEEQQKNADSQVK